MKNIIDTGAGRTMALVSCEEWLDNTRWPQMSPETFFSNENELQAFSNKFHTVFPSDGPSTTSTGTTSFTNDLPQETRGAARSPRIGRRWLTWTDLRDINTLLEYSVNCKDRRP